MWMSSIGLTKALNGREFLKTFVTSVIAGIEK